MSPNEKYLVWLLRLAGAVMLLAWLAVFLPVEWMAAGHQMLGLGEFPESPLVDYLTRSISILYGFHGGFLLVLSTDVRRYRRVITYVGSMNIVFGALMVPIDFRAGMPVFWTLGEGPPILAVGVLMLYLVRSLPPEETA